MKSMFPPIMPMPSPPEPYKTSAARPPGEEIVDDIDEHVRVEDPNGGVVAAFQVRERIGREHSLLRGLARALVGAAKAAEKDEKERYVIREILRQLLDEMDRHFAYEESVAAPLLQRAEGWGPICARRMAREHEDQRTTLCALAEDAEDGVRTIEELTEEIRWFFRRFEQDMSDEEERLASAARSAS